MKRREDTSILEHRVPCPNCGHENPADSLVCKRCGRLVVPLDDRPGGPSPARARETGDARSASDDTLVIHIRDSSTPINCRIGNELVIGRHDADSGTFPDLDLSLYDAMEKGVSRRHAAIRRQGNFFYLVDLGSANSTFLNGQRLAPHQPGVLRDGDEIRLGRLVLRVYFQRGATL